MSIVQYGAIIDKMRGSIRGTTFSSSGGVEVAKGKSTPRNPKGASQGFAKSLMATYAPNWRNLSGTVRGNWDSYALTYAFKNSLGNIYHISGLQHYVRASLFLNQRGTAAAATVPTASGAPVLSYPTLAKSGDDLTLASFSPAFPGSCELRGTIYNGCPTTRNRPSTGKFEDVYYTGASLPVVIAADYYAGFPTGAEVRAFLKFRFMDANKRISVETFVSLDETI